MLSKPVVVEYPELPEIPAEFTAGWEDESGRLLIEQNDAKDFSNPVDPQIAQSAKEQVEEMLKRLEQGVEL